MDINVLRYNSKGSFTEGLFFIDCDFKCYTIEDEYRDTKAYGKTRISNGRYKIEFKTTGVLHNKYLKKYGHDFHRGMLWVKNVPNFENILIHVGNTDEDTSGCLLVGMTQNADEQGFIGGSITAYKKIYPIIRDALLNREEVYINYKTY